MDRELDIPFMDSKKIIVSNRDPMFMDSEFAPLWLNYESKELFEFHGNRWISLSDLHHEYKAKKLCKNLFPGAD